MADRANRSAVGVPDQMVVRRADARANQARVLEAGRQVFAEQGLAAEIKDIADRAGVGVATIYRGFGSKEALLEATVEQADAAVSDLLAVAESTDDAVEALRLLISGLLDYGKSYGWLIQASLAGTDFKRPETSRKKLEVHRQRAMRLIERAIPDDLAPDFARLVVDGTVVMTTLRVRRHEPHPPEAAIADGLVRLLTGTKTRESER
jgi:AcrR family transcriptional regulator